MRSCAGCRRLDAIAFGKYFQVLFDFRNDRGASFKVIDDMRVSILLHTYCDNLRH